MASAQPASTAPGSGSSGGPGMNRSTSARRELGLGQEPLAGLGRHGDPAAEVTGTQGRGEQSHAEDPPAPEQGPS